MHIAIDFDGVLHSYKQGFTGATDLPGLPVPGALEFVQQALAKGHQVTVFSCRARRVVDCVGERDWDEGGKEAMAQWLAKHGFPELPITGVKPAAHLYLDDRAYRFVGRWPSLDRLTRLRPWYESNALRNFMGLNEHPQEILTPANITDCVREIFGGPIACDPCATHDPRQTVNATYGYYGAGGNVDDDGLHVSWGDRTFCNPPFAQLRKWLAKAEQEACSWGNPSIIVLCPMRSRSVWFRAARRSADVCVELNRIVFVGYTSSFPESCALLIWNVPAKRVRAALKNFPIGEIY
jgi:DNA N-6-adenine-methyltransferase (Dam)